MGQVAWAEGVVRFLIAEPDNSNGSAFESFEMGEVVGRRFSI